jgi:hypothetical protein
MLFNYATLVVGTFAAQAIAVPFIDLEERAACTADNAAVRKDWYHFLCANLRGGF